MLFQEVEAQTSELYVSLNTDPHSWQQYEQSGLENPEKANISGHDLGMT